MQKLCLYFNIPSQYREEIYTCINNEYQSEWFFEVSSESIKPFKLDGFKHTFLRTTKISGFYWTKGLLRLLRKDFDSYIMIGATRCLSLYFFLILKNLFYRKKKVLLWTHGYYGKESWVEKNIFKRPLLKMADGLLLYGDYARGLMLKDGFNPNTTFAIHNSLAYTEQLKLRESIAPSTIYKDHFGNNDPVLIFLGRLTTVKQLDMILDAVDILRKKGENYNLIFVGDGAERERLEKKTESLGICERVWFYGACYDEKQNAELVYNADLCVAPGNIGLTVIHTLMFGCPAVTHGDFSWQMPEFETIHPGETGGFFERNNVNSLAEVISHWFATQSECRNTVRQSCYAEIDNYWNPNYQMNVIAKALEA